MKTIKVRINRKKWLRGNETAGSAVMRNHSGSMCCLGYVARACGVKAAALVGAPEPQEVREDARTSEFSRLFNKKKMRHNKITSKAIDANDREGLTPTQREKEIRKTLAKLKFDVKFFG